MKTQSISALAAAGLLVMGATASRIALAEGPHSVSANIGAVSNYVWRGQSQTDDGPAIQGGLDYAHQSGFSAGTWVSNVDFGDGTNYELDLYAGFGGAINDDLSYALKLTYYAYPDGRDLDFSEIGASATYKWLTLGLDYTFYGQADDAKGVPKSEANYIEGDLYYHASLDFELPYELGLSLRGGYYDFRYNDGGNDYAHWGVSISREAGDFGTFSLNYDQVGRDTYDDDPKVWVGWLKEF
ncbi:MAG: TorF family putative porin [Chromatiales bacterium]|nr:TorF family putative porin [Chromatiales bacterium]